MTKTAYQTQKIFFALGTVCTLTVFGGDSLHALERAKNRVLEIARKTKSDNRSDILVTIGYAAAEAGKILRASGVDKAVIVIGSTVVSIGAHRVGIRHPFKAEDESFAFIDIEDNAVVTGQLRDNSCRPDGRRGLRLAEESLASVTLIGKSAVQLSALCNSVFPMTLKNAMALLNETEVEAIFVTETQEVFTTVGLTKRSTSSRWAA